MALINLILSTLDSQKFYLIKQPYFPFFSIIKIKSLQSENIDFIVKLWYITSGIY